METNRNLDRPGSSYGQEEGRRSTRAQENDEEYERSRESSPRTTPRDGSTHRRRDNQSGSFADPQDRRGSVYGQEEEQRHVRAEERERSRHSSQSTTPRDGSTQRRRDNQSGSFADPQDRRGSVYGQEEEQRYVRAEERERSRHSSQSTTPRDGSTPRQRHNEGGSHADRQTNNRNLERRESAHSQNNARGGSTRAEQYERSRESKHTNTPRDGSTPRRRHNDGESDADPQTNRNLDRRGSAYSEEKARRGSMGPPTDSYRRSRESYSQSTPPRDRNTPREQRNEAGSSAEPQTNKRKLERRRSADDHQERERPTRPLEFKRPRDRNSSQSTTPRDGNTPREQLNEAGTYADPQTDRNLDRGGSGYGQQKGEGAMRSQEYQRSGESSQSITPRDDRPGQPQNEAGSSAEPQTNKRKRDGRGSADDQEEREGSTRQGPEYKRSRQSSQSTTPGDGTPRVTPRQRQNEAGSSRENALQEPDDEEPTETPAKAELRKFLSARLFNSYRITNDSTTEKATFNKIVEDFSKYLTSRRGIDALLPAKPSVQSRLDKNADSASGLMLANHYALHWGGVETESVQIYVTRMDGPHELIRYKVRWVKRTLSKDIKIQLWRLLMDGRDGKDPNKFNSVPAVYDGGAMVCASKPFGFDLEELNTNDGITLSIPFREGIENLTITFREIIHGSDLSTYLKPDSKVKFPQKVVQVYNLIMKQYCKLKNYIESGSFYFEREERPLGKGLHRRSGYHQSIRILEGGLLLNVDVMHAAFYNRMQLSEALTTLLQNGHVPVEQSRHFPDFTRPFLECDHSRYEQQVEVVNQFFKDLKISSNHRSKLSSGSNDAEPPQSFSVFGVMAKRTDEQTVKILFPRDPSEEKNLTTNLIDFMKERYKYEGQDLESLLKHYPAIQVSKAKKYFLPWGCCSTSEESRFKGKINDTNHLKQLQRTLQERYTTIRDWMSARYDYGAIDETELERAFAVTSVLSKMLPVNALNLPPPELEAGVILNRDRLENRIKRGQNASFDLQFEQQFKRPAQVRNWAILSFTVNERTRDEETYIQELTSAAKRRGMTLETDRASFFYRRVPVSRRGETNAWKLMTVKRQFTDFIKEAGEEAGRLPQLIVIFMPDKLTPEYASLKYLCDIHYGVPSQMIVMKPPKKLNRISMLKIVESLLLKINVKCGGENFDLAQGTLRETPTIDPTLRDHTFLMGADITHAGANGTYSVAAVVATTGRHLVNYACRMKAQKRGVDQVMGLKDMVKELLKLYIEGNDNIYPAKIVFFRDGISESQFFPVLRQEGIAILEAVEELSAERATEHARQRPDGPPLEPYKPSVVIVLAIKRHHTRFFVTDQKKGRPQGVRNLNAGTVVTSGVTHHKEYDFFLCSHHTTVGTARATHYKVLLDMAEVNPDELYQLVFNLCHTFQRCTKSVSLVTPVYYAHLAAFRGKLYMEYYNSKAEAEIKDLRDDLNDAKGRAEAANRGTHGRRQDELQDLQEEIDRLDRQLTVKVRDWSHKENLQFDAHKDLRNKLWFL